MACKQSKGQKDTAERVMHEFKHGDLKTAGRSKMSKDELARALQR